MGMTAHRRFREHFRGFTETAETVRSLIEIAETAVVFSLKPLK
jgi:hypothetical protein